MPHRPIPARFAVLLSGERIPVWCTERFVLTGGDLVMDVADQDAARAEVLFDLHPNGTFDYRFQEYEWPTPG